MHCQVFQYLPALCTVTAHAAPPADNNLLKAMFPGDDGSSLPSEAAALRQGPPFKFNASRAARPYRSVVGCVFVLALRSYDQQGLARFSVDTLLPAACTPNCAPFIQLMLLNQVLAITTVNASLYTFRWCQHLAGLDFVPTLPVLAAHLQGSEQVSGLGLQATVFSLCAAWKLLQYVSLSSCREIVVASPNEHRI